MLHTHNAFGFLLGFILHVIALILIARLVFQWVGVHTSNPIAQFVLRVTQPVIGLLQKVFPTIKRFNTAVLVALLLVNLLFVAASFLLTGANVPPYLVLVLSLSQLVQQNLDFLFWSVLIHVLFSWIPNAGFHPVAQVVYPVVNPLLRPLQRLLPTLGGIDFSPVVLIVLIKFVEILLLGR